MDDAITTHLQPITARALRIARWLTQNASAPVVSELAVLYQQSDTWELVARWPKEQATRELHTQVAIAIDETLRGIANEMRTRVASRVVWYTTEGKEWISLPLHVVPDNPDDERPNLDGSQLAFLKQAQAHAQAAVQLCMQTSGELMGHLRESVAELREYNRELAMQLRSAYEANREISEELDEASERERDAIDTAEKVTEAAEEAVAEAEKQHEGKVLRLIAQAAAGVKIPGVSGEG